MSSGIKSVCTRAVESCFNEASASLKSSVSSCQTTSRSKRSLESIGIEMTSFFRRLSPQDPAVVDRPEPQVAMHSDQSREQCISNRTLLGVLLVGGAILFGVALGVGLGLGLRNDDSSSESQPRMTWSTGSVITTSVSTRKITSSHLPTPWIVSAGGDQVALTSTNSKPGSELEKTDTSATHSVPGGAVSTVRPPPPAGKS